MTSASYCSASQRIATDVSSPPEYARTIRRMTPCTSLEPLIQSFRQTRGVGSAAADHENRVVARNRADDLGQTRAIDRHCQRLGQPRVGLQHDQLVDDVVAAEII